MTEDFTLVCLILQRIKKKKEKKRKYCNALKKGKYCTLILMMLQR